MKVTRKANSWCLICGKGSYCPPSRKAIGQGKFCSVECMGISKKGKKDPNLTHKYPKGHISWNKGKGRIDANCLNCSKEMSILVNYKTKFCSRKCYHEHVRSDFNELGYGAKHKRIKERYGVPKSCEICKTEDSPKFEWANISGKYQEDRSDWIRLCCQCHRRYDRGTKNKIYITQNICA